MMKVRFHPLARRRCLPHSRLALLALAALIASPPLLAQSHWVHFGPDGRLVYAQTPQGDHILDFSYAGYRGGGVALPSVPQRRTVTPSGGDDTAAIQSAIDAVSKLPLVHGFRGAVELAPGVFHCSATLNITASGVVLRGAGDDEKTGSTLQLTGDPHLGVRVAGQLVQRELDHPTTLADAYVPSGAMVIHVADASAIHPGDTLLLVKPVTPAWVHFMGMDNLARNGKAEHWVVGDLTVRRRVASVRGNAVTLDVPLTDSIDARFFPGVHPPVTRIDLTGQIAEDGVEQLRIVAPARVVGLGQGPLFDALSMRDAVDSWIRDLHIEDTTGGVSVGSGTERITVTRVDILEHNPVTTSAKPADFVMNGSQILLDRCTARGDKVFYVVTQAKQEGPVVALHCRFLGDGHIQPHQRWSTGLLIDNTDVPGGGIDLMNRGEMGSGHGWPIGWSVLWNNTAASFVVQSPPGAANWSIGDRGQHNTAPMPVYGVPKGPPLPGSIIESPGKPVQPASLYLEQLKERLGPGALKAIGYDSAN
jgi:hypothetical protein